MNSINNPIFEFTRAEVAKHNKPNDAWIIINNNVHNITGYKQIHPGGSAILEKLAGTDATDSFNTSNHFKNRSVQQFLKITKIGKIKK